MKYRLEVVQLPVSDVDRAKAFYARLGWRLDADFPFDNGFRIVQFTPPGSGCSIHLSAGILNMPPGVLEGLQLVVSDIEAARTRLLDGGVEVSEVQDFPWGRFVFFADPDGNRWSVQQIVRPG